jgi:hypothetical protein
MKLIPCLNEQSAFLQTGEIRHPAKGAFGIGGELGILGSKAAKNAKF